jgi:hypothetical protein
VIPPILQLAPTLTLEQAVAEAVAAGATCWTVPLDGTFDNARADRISVELVSWIRAHYDLDEITHGEDKP